MISLVVAIIIIFSQASLAYAINRDFGLDVVQFPKDVTVKAPQSTITLTFPVPSLAKINAAAVTIVMTPGPQLSNEALFYFYHNDKLLDTRTAKDLRQKKSVVIKLPTGTDFKDAVRVQVKSNMFISNDLCRDYYSGGLFFTIHRGTKLNLNYDTIPVRNTADFLGNFQQSLLIVVPANATLPEMMPAVWAYGLLKKNYPHLDMQLIRAGDLANKANAPRIWVGLRNQLPAYFSKTQSGIVLADSNTLLISAGALPELEATTKKLAEMVSSPGNSADNGRLMANPVLTAKENSRDAISFGNTEAQVGILQVATEFDLYSAMLRGVPEAIGFHIEGSYLVSLDQNRPVRLDVFFNSKLIHSSVLDQTGRFSKDINLPSGAELLTRNKLKLQFNYPEELGQCQVLGKLQSAQIFPTSYMWGTGHKKVDHFTWSDVGMFLTQPGTVLLDDNLGDNPLQLLAGLIVFLNQQLPTSRYAFPAVQTMADLAFVPTDQYVVALAKTGKLPIFLQDLLPGPEGQGSSSYCYNSSALPIEAQPNVKSVVGKIAENKGFPVIVFSTNFNGNLLSEAIRYLTDPGNYEQIVGNILTYTQPGRLYSLDVRNSEKSAAVTKPIVNQSGNRFWDQNKKEITIIGAVLLVIIVLLLLFGYLRRRRIERESHYAYENDEPDEADEPDPVILVSTAKRRGRPKKKLPVQEEVPALPPPSEEDSPIPKRRGRPKKQVVFENNVPLKTAAPTVATVNTKNSVAARIGDAATIEPAPKKRGRPSKREMVGIDSQLKSKAPSEAASDTTSVDSSKTVKAAAKKRGRPPKQMNIVSTTKVEESEPITKINEVEVAMTAEPILRGRGRPKKNKVQIPSAEDSMDSGNIGEEEVLAEATNLAAVVLPAKRRSARKSLTAFKN